MIYVRPSIRLCRKHDTELIDGVWDKTVKAIGPYAYAHTNLTEIQLGLELLWRNNINPARVNMGLGFYGRSMSTNLIVVLPATDFGFSVYNERFQLHARRM